MNVDIVKALHATKEDEGASLAVIVTSSNLEPVAERWAASHGLEVIEGPKLVDLFTQYCDPEQPRGTPNSRFREDTGATPDTKGLDFIARAIKRAGQIPRFVLMRKASSKGINKAKFDEMVETLVQRKEVTRASSSHGGVVYVWNVTQRRLST